MLASYLGFLGAVGLKKLSKAPRFDMMTESVVDLASNCKGCIAYTAQMQNTVVWGNTSSWLKQILSNYGLTEDD